MCLSTSISVHNIFTPSMRAWERDCWPISITLQNYKNPQATFIHENFLFPRTLLLMELLKFLAHWKQKFQNQEIIIKFRISLLKAYLEVNTKFSILNYCSCMFILYLFFMNWRKDSKEPHGIYNASMKYFFSKSTWSITRLNWKSEMSTKCKKYSPFSKVAILKKQISLTRITCK